MSIDYDKLRALCEAATPGPWEAYEGGVAEVRIDKDHVICRWTGFDASDYPLEQDKANSDFIAAAREAVPALLDDAVHRQEAIDALVITLRVAAQERDKARAEVEQLRDECEHLHHAATEAHANTRATHRPQPR